MWIRPTLAITDVVEGEAYQNQTLLKCVCVEFFYNVNFCWHNVKPG